jgi:hypothetical protein
MNSTSSRRIDLVNTSVICWKLLWEKNLLQLVLLLILTDGAGQRARTAIQNLVITLLGVNDLSTILEPSSLLLDQAHQSRFVLLLPLPLLLVKDTLFKLICDALIVIDNAAMRGANITAMLSTSSSTQTGSVRIVSLVVKNQIRGHLFHYRTLRMRVV